MRKIRLIALVSILAVVGANPWLIAGEEAGCCTEFDNHCHDYCTLGGHGGALLTQCGYFMCLERCICEDSTIHDHPNGTYCLPCGT